MIARVTSKKYMPPWPADPSYTHFKDENILSEEEIKLLGDWYRSGIKTGDTSEIKYPEILNTGSRLGKPDLVLNLTRVPVFSDNRDRFYVIKIPVMLHRDTFIRAVEFIPGVPSVVHHMNGHLLNFRTKDSAILFGGPKVVDTESEFFAEGFSGMSLLNDDGSIPERIHSAVNYLPGTTGIMYPPGIGGFPLSASAAFVANDIHYGPSTKKHVDSSKLLVYFSKKAPDRPTYEIMLGTNGVSEIKPPLVIPAGSKTRHITQVSIYNDISVLTVNPHMHLIGKSIKAYAIKPNADTVRLISIPRWQFLWQYFYTFNNPVRIPKGSRIVVEAEYDNTTSNPNNPFSPPRTISERFDRGGASMRTTDEMLQFIITYMPYQEGDEKIDLNLK
jgi:hypothetical protein